MICPMPSTKSPRATVAFLIAGNEAHKMALAKALESLGFNWGKILPIHKKIESPEYQK